MPKRKISIKPTRTKTTAISTSSTASSDLKEELLKWICERHATNGPLDREILRRKALEIATSLGINGFKCSEGWLTVFLKKYGFSPSLTNCDGPTFPDYRVWVDLLRSLITRYRHRDLFSVDELVMYADLLPAKISSMALRHRNQRGDDITIEKSPSTRPDLPSEKNNRIGMLICCNSSGTEKLEPLISGPYEVKDTRKDCRYHRDESSTITDDVFADWLAKFNREMSKSDRKILLLLSRDRIRALKRLPEMSHVNLVFFPKDFPIELRPLRGDVFHCAKMIYRKRYIEHICSSARPWGPEEIVDAIARAWKGVSQEFIVSNFRRTKFREDEFVLKIECPAWENLQTGISFRRFVTFDDDLAEGSSLIPEDLRRIGGHDGRYDLRRSNRDPADLIVIEETNSTNAPRGRDSTKRNAERRVKVRPEVPSDYRDSSSKDPRIGADRRNPGNSPVSGSSSSNDETEDRSLVERIEDFLDNFADPSAEDNNFAIEPSGSGGNQENANRLINAICRKSHDERNLMERCLGAVSSDGDCAAALNDRDSSADSRSPRRDSIEEVDSPRDENEASRANRDELAENFPGEAGPSGETVDAETLGYKNQPVVAEFDDEEIPLAGQLKLKIIQAIESCDELERSNFEDIQGHGRDQNGGDVTVGNLLNPKTSKRTRDNPKDDEDEPTEKRARQDGSWSKRYETNFVFGPDIRESSSQSAESWVADDTSPNNREAVAKSKTTQTRSLEAEKQRCIFTLDGNAPGVSFPTSKD